MDPFHSAPRGVFRRRAAWMAVLCALASSSAIIAPWWPEATLPWLQWLLGLAVHWQWLYLVVGLAAAGAAAVRGARRALLAVPVLLLAWWVQSPAADDTPVPGSTPLRVATANLQIGHTDLVAFSGWLTGPGAPDIVMLQEFGDDAARLVAQGDLLARYPYQVLAPASDPFGIALLSRHPFTFTETLTSRPDPRQTPRLRARVRWQGREVALSAMHPMPPLDAPYALARDRGLREEAAWLRASGVPGVLAGDLNDTPWSTGLRGVAPTLKRASGLRPTWPNLGGWLSALPLDHVLVTAGWTRGKSAIGPDLGSDHRPVVVDLLPTR